MKRILLFLILFFGVVYNSNAACHTVSVAGSGTNSGADWNNTMANLPATLVRGDTYFMQDGTGYVLQGLAAASGTTYTYVRKAVATSVTGSAVTAHCTDTGWNAGTMGSAQAIFNGSTGPAMYGFSYFQLDGQTRTSLNSGYGIKIDTSSCSNAQCYTLLLGYNATAKASNIIVQYVEFNQSNQNGTTNFDQDYGVYAYNNDNGTPASGALHDILLQYNYHHNSACDFIFTRGVTNFTVQGSYFYENNGGSNCHGQGWEDNNSVNITLRYNVLNEIRGTADFVVLCDICSGATIPTTGFYAYGNVFMDSSGGAGWTADGTMACLGPSISCTHMYFLNNTIAGLQNTGAGAGSNASGVGQNSVTTSDVLCENNIWYNINANVTISNSCNTEDYNTAIFSGSLTGVFTGAHDVVDVTNQGSNFTSPSVAAPAPSDFTLISDTGNDFKNGLTQSSPYNQSCIQLVCTSMTTRASNGTWDRGAYQIPASGGGGFVPPTSVIILSLK